MVRIRKAAAVLGVAFAASSAAAADPSLVAHWTFDEGAGAFAQDSSGNGHTGAVLGAEWTAGLVGRALRFDGATSSVRVPSSPALEGRTGLTIEAWVKLARNDGPRVIVCKWDDVNREWSYIFKKHNDVDGLRMELSRDVHTDLADVAGAESLPLDRWIHVATTYDREVVRLFVNGREDAAAASWVVPGTIDASATDLLIGAVNPGNASEVFDGVIDEVSVYSRALSPDEIAARFAALRPLVEETAWRDQFDGAALDPSTWGAGIATSGVRWCSSAGWPHHSSSGQWLDPSVTPCNGTSWSPSAWGSVAVQGGVATFSGLEAPGFPYVWRGAPSPGAAFPAAGDFRLGVRMRFDAYQGHGTGLQVVRWADVTPAGDNPPIPAGGSVFTVWADTGSWAPRFGLLEPDYTYGSQVVVGDDGHAWHDFELEYRGGAYSVRVDRGPWSEPVPSGVRADALWLGNPVLTHWGVGPWTSFSLDGIGVVALPVLAGVDVRPGGYPNAVNLANAGVVPFAILGSASLDVLQVVPASVSLASAGVALRRDGTPMVSYSDVDGDGFLDLVAQVPTSALQLSDADQAAIVDARLADGRTLRGADSVRVRVR